MSVSTMFSSFLFIFHVSRLFKRTDRMLELNKRNLVLIVIWLLFHMGVNLLKVVLARPILLLMSSLVPPVLVKIASRYVNDLTSISFPSVLVIGWLVLVLNFITFVFPALILRPVE